MQAYLNIQDLSNALRICKSYKKNPKGYYDIHDYILAKQYISDFMKEIWNIVKSCSVSLREAFALIRGNTASMSHAIKAVEGMLVKAVKTLTPKAISQLLRAEKQQQKQNSINEQCMRVRVKRYWNRHESRFHRQTVCVPIPLSDNELKALQVW